MKKTIFLTVLISLLVLGAIIPAGYWMFHPELTKMQLFFHFWWVVPIQVACVGILFFWLDREW